MPQFPWVRWCLMLGNYGKASKDNLPGGSFTALKCREAKFGSVTLWPSCLAKISLSLKLKVLFTNYWWTFLFFSKTTFTLKRHNPVKYYLKYNFRQSYRMPFNIFSLHSTCSLLLQGRCFKVESWYQYLVIVSNNVWFVSEVIIMPQMDEYCNWLTF